MVSFVGGCAVEWIPQTLSYKCNKLNINTKYQGKEIKKMTMSAEI